MVKIDFWWWKPFIYYLSAVVNGIKLNNLNIWRINFLKLQNSVIEIWIFRLPAYTGGAWSPKRYGWQNKLNACNKKLNRNKIGTLNPSRNFKNMAGWLGYEATAADWEGQHGYSNLKHKISFLLLRFAERTHGFRFVFLWKSYPPCAERVHALK